VPCPGGGCAYYRLSLSASLHHVLLFEMKSVHDIACTNHLLISKPICCKVSTSEMIENLSLNILCSFLLNNNNEFSGYKWTGGFQSRQCRPHARKTSEQFRI